ncbi:MAG: bifunctional nicotinamidase/pyrazinamidase, partial [Spirochaetaceae bacterium]|nr:bifunctional nicotinamidase/pyrazinamidase [Spirochaetaceae bacterium]
MKIDYKHSAFLIIDVQNDFCSGGALAVHDAEAIISPLNKFSHQFTDNGSPVIATQDWHPAQHCSFTVQGGTWPEHCLQGSWGAELHHDLDLRPISCIMRKGINRIMDSYSAFYENDRTTATGLAGMLKARSITTVYLGGLATDYCVLYSALDAATLGFSVFVFEQAIRAVNYPHGSREK